MKKILTTKKTGRVTKGKVLPMKLSPGTKAKYDGKDTTFKTRSERQMQTGMY